MADKVDSKDTIGNKMIPDAAGEKDLSDNIISFEQCRKLHNELTQSSEPDDELNLNEIINQAISNIISENAKKHTELTLAVKPKENDYKADFIDTMLKAELTKENFEDIFCLNGLNAVELPFSDDDNIKNIRYKDDKKNTLAIVQINNDNNKIRLQNFGNILPKQEFQNPQQVNYKVMNESGLNGWTTEYGGVNQFDGSIEIRYKDSEDNVMAAVIFNSDGDVDTVAEYRYKNGKKVQMYHTSRFGHSKTIYDEVTDIAKLIVDIDTDGNVCCVTRELSGEVVDFKAKK